MMGGLGQVSSEEASSARQRVRQLARTLRVAIWVLGSLIAGVFTWVQLRDVPWELLAYTDATNIQRFTLVVYYFSWVFGSGYDLGTQEAVYTYDPGKGRLGSTAWALLGAFGVLAVALYWTSDDYRAFAVVLTCLGIFWGVNLFYFLQRLRSMIRKSERQYMDDGQFFGATRVKIVGRYAAGQWQVWRYVVIVLLIAVVDVVSFSSEARTYLSGVVQQLAPARLPSVEGMLPSVAFVLFVLITEGWIWGMRVKTTVSIGVVDELSEQYRLVPITTDQAGFAHVDR